MRHAGINLRERRCVLARMALLIAAPLLLLLLSGCDNFCGVQRQVQVKRLPSDSEITSAIWRVPGMERVDTSHWEASNGYEYRLPAKLPYTIDGDEMKSVGGIVIPYEDREGNKWLTLYYGWMNYVPPKHTVDETRSVMDQVYRQLRDSCPYLPPPDDLQEKWTGPSPRNKAFGIFPWL
jgi:hypothetical protein